MQYTGSDNNTNCLVEFDSKGPQPNGFNGTIRYEITQKNPKNTEAYRTVINRFRERDSGNPKTLIDSLRWLFSDYPAKKYLICLWNHGSGFRRSRRSRSPIIVSEKLARQRGTLFGHSNRQLQRVILSDDLSGNSMDMIELARALKKSGISERNKISVLGFDACLMNMLEVSFGMLPLAEYIVGSEEEEPDEGWPYALDLKSLNKAKISPRQLSKELVLNYKRYYQTPPHIFRV